MAKINLDVAQESTVQEILDKVQNNEKYTNITLIPADSGIKISVPFEMTKDVASDRYQKFYSFIPKNSGVIRFKLSMTVEITANTYTGSSGSSHNVDVFITHDSKFFEVANKTDISGANNAQKIGGASVGIGKSATYPVGTKESGSFSIDYAVTQGVPVILCMGRSGHSAFTNITVKATGNVDIIYKEVSW